MNKTKQMPPVPCSFSKMMPTGDLVPNPRNPNTHPESQIELLAKIIDFQGWRLPIVTSKQSGFVVRGHGRLLAARKLGMEMVPVDEQDYESEAQEWADLVADNRIAELAEMDRASLKDIIETLDTGEIDMELTGFTESELEDLMSEFFVPEEEHGRRRIAGPSGSKDQGRRFVATGKASAFMRGLYQGRERRQGHRGRRSGPVPY